MDMEHEIPKKLGLLAAHGDGEPPKTLGARYVKEIMLAYASPTNRIAIVITGLVI